MDGTGVMSEPFTRVLPPELPPAVLSYPPDRVLAYDQILPLVQKSLPCLEPFILLGESFSGPLALMAAAQSPPGLCGVVLCASFVRSPARWVPRMFHRVAGASASRLVPRFIQRKALLGRYVTPYLAQLLDRAHATVAPPVLAARVRAVLAVDVVAQLKACPVPILYLRGEHDRVVSERSLQIILREQPSVQVVTLPAPHLVLQTQPEAAARAIHAFANAQGSPALA
ncbi:MAG: lysophospholipase [Planctomycetes bacterium]|nr:lysophospholipase [Planctomycetota bacterium]